MNILLDSHVFHIVLAEAILKMKKFKEVTIKEIEKPMKSWMPQAPSRIKKNAEKID